MLRHFNFSQESDVVSTQADNDTNTAKTIREKEYTYYVRISNFKQLENASHAEKHEQWQALIPKNDLNAGEAHIRARKITSSSGEVQYELTLKSKAKNDSKIESTVIANEQIFTQIAFIADYGMRKDRYTFPIEGSNLKWEVDVYPDGKAGYYTWAKVDLEIKENIDKVPELPIEVEEVITPNDALTPEGKAKVDGLFKTYFLLQNKYKPLDKLESKPQSGSPSDSEEKPSENTDTSGSDGSADDNQDNQDESTPEESDNSNNEDTSSPDESSSSDTEEKDNDESSSPDEDGEVDKA